MGRHGCRRRQPAAWPASRLPDRYRAAKAQQYREKIHPDQKGTRRLTERFGDRLVCVRYRSDPESGRRFTTVEIVVEERSPTTPEPSHQLVRVGWKETQLRDAIKASGGIWMPDMKLWKVSGSTIRRLKLKKRIVTESA